jgi:CBS domain-containing protein
MDFTSPISNFMTRKLVTVLPSDRLTKVKEIFDTTKIHHIPVVRYTTLVGLVSKTDLMYFIKGVNTTEYDEMIQKSRLHNYTVEDIMTEHVATLESTERINVALQLFSENLFHSIPIVDNNELVGMLTTFDIIKALMEEDLVRMKTY